MKHYEYYVGDFETTVYDGQTETEVWASAIVKLQSEDVLIFHDIKTTFNYLLSLNKNIVVYYHNLKFDGSFWLNFLLHTEFKSALENNQFIADKYMKNKTFKYSISDMGNWYSITIKYNNHFIEFRDSLKLLPFSVKRIGDSFGTKHKKLSMEYKGKRFAGCEITDKEKEYIANDVLVVKEALEIMFAEGHTSLTIGACCLKEFKHLMGDKQMYEYYFPDLTQILIPEEIYGSPNADAYIRNSYKGGWCYVVQGKENKIHTDGVTLDVNSLYPSMMSSESGNYYPICKPTFWKGDYIPDEALNGYYFVRIKTQFFIKPNHLPCIQLKHNLRYIGNEWLSTSDVYDRFTGMYSHYIKTFSGDVVEADVTLTLTMTDFELIKDHYTLKNLQILDGCYFNKYKGIFDLYIDKYKKIKMENKGAKRELAKLFLNNLYGKLASSTNSSFKVAFLEDDTLKFYDIREYNKNAGYIAIGSAITSYARNFTIRTAQANFYGQIKNGFIYADTDSIHCDLPLSQIKNVELSDTEFCKWKAESFWNIAYFARQKTYIEHVTHENQQPVTPYYNIKCAGMPERCKQLFNESLLHKTRESYTDEEWEKFTEEEQDFILQWRDIEDFSVGLTVPSKLIQKNIKGGVILKDTTYEMR